jgi:hypothetical protein
MGVGDMYKKYTKKQFEYLLKNVLITNRLGFLTDVTARNLDSWEYMYEVTTRNKAVSIIIYSSVDLRTNSTRDNGADRVRLVVRWTTKNGDMYKRLARHNRLETLFENVKSTLSSFEPFNLNYKEFKKQA